MGALTETPYLIPDNRSFLETTLAFVVESLAFYLYVAYAERLTSEARRSPEPIPVFRVLRNLFLAAPVVPIVAVASLAAIALPTAAASLLVVPGIWVMTRWSLFAPVIVSELLGPLAALKRSNELVRGNFELVLLTAAFAVVLEDAFADAGMLGGSRSPARKPGENGWGDRLPPCLYCLWLPSRPPSCTATCGAWRTTPAPEPPEAVRYVVGRFANRPRNVQPRLTICVTAPRGPGGFRLSVGSGWPFPW